MVDALVKLMNSPDGLVGPVNVGNPSEMSILDLARKVIALVGSGSEIVFKPLPSDDPIQRKPDITLARDALKWQPSTTLETGLERTIAYFRSAGPARQA
jgi:UDP-glucuronate decarboxylase